MGIHIVGTGQGGEFRKGLATVLIGGLLTSMFLTLLVVPTAYSLMESLTERGTRLFRRLFDRDALAEEEAEAEDSAPGKPNDKQAGRQPDREAAPIPAAALPYVSTPASTIPNPQSVRQFSNEE